MVARLNFWLLAPGAMPETETLFHEAACNQSSGHQPRVMAMIQPLTATAKPPDGQYL